MNGNITTQGFVLPNLEDYARGIEGLEVKGEEMFGWAVIKAEPENIEKVLKLKRAVARGEEVEDEPVGLRSTIVPTVLNDYTNFLVSSGEDVTEYGILPLKVDEKANTLGGLNVQSGEGVYDKENVDFEKIEALNLTLHDEEEDTDKDLNCLTVKYVGGRKGVLFFDDLENLEATEYIFAYVKLITDEQEDGSLSTNFELVYLFSLYKAFELDDEENAELVEYGYNALEDVEDAEFYIDILKNTFENLDMSILVDDIILQNTLFEQ